MTNNTLPYTFAECLTKSNKLPKICFPCLSFITALHLTKETNDEEEHLLTFISLLLWLRIITFFIQSLQVWLCNLYLWLLGSLSLCKQFCVIRLLLCCFENHHACLVSSWANIVTVAAFWANLFLWLLFWRCFDSQLAGAIVIMLVSKTANFTLFSLFLLTGGFPDL